MAKSPHDVLNYSGAPVARFYAPALDVALAVMSTDWRESNPTAADDTLIQRLYSGKFKTYKLGDAESDLNAAYIAKVIGVSQDDVLADWATDRALWEKGKVPPTPGPTLAKLSKQPASLFAAKPVVKAKPKSPTMYTPTSPMTLDPEDGGVMAGIGILGVLAALLLWKKKG